MRAFFCAYVTTLKPLLSKRTFLPFTSRVSKEVMFFNWSDSLTLKPLPSYCHFHFDIAGGGVVAVKFIAIRAFFTFNRQSAQRRANFSVIIAFKLQAGFSHPLASAMVATLVKSAWLSGFTSSATFPAPS